MQRTLELLKAHNQLRIIDEPLDIVLEIPHVAYIEAKKPDGKALLFTHPIDRANNKTFDVPVLMNIFGSYGRTKLLFGQDIEGVADQISELLHMKPPKGLREKFSLASNLLSLKRVFPKRLKSRKNPSQEVVYLGDAVDLTQLPILTTWSQDGGPFITMGQVYTQSLDGELANLGMYRLQVYDKNRLGMHWQIHKDASHFFDQYQRAGKKMPVSIGIGGDPLYIWCGQAPMPYGINELLLYGFVKGEAAKVAQSLTNPIWVPHDVDYVIEGWLDPRELKIEGPFGDHTGYYTLKEHYPVLEVTAITHKKNPVYLATVVGKPPIEDKYMGWATERIFLPLLKTTAPDLIDYHMPENGVFHNLILAKIQPMYKGHAKQIMHAFWGVGQMSFVKHAIFVGPDASRLTNYDTMTNYILDHIEPKRILLSEGVVDALDHSADEKLVGGKLGVDCTLGVTSQESIVPLDDATLLEKLHALDSQIVALKQYKLERKNPVVVVAVDKSQSMQHFMQEVQSLEKHLRIVIIVDKAKNDLDNPYMLIWRVVNNMDALRDVKVGSVIVLDGTTKSSVDGFTREWPDDVECDAEVLKSLQERGVVDIDEAFIKRFYL
ncbi:MAG: 3-octaprenyl-4-hydroxybenzoate carboxy-lyase [Sulfurovum sp. PC08-66]|nr:MAG: 3-octaprenyl-4-hydroxybenzoate carboxy-lyase [Sulfurovum sp. PC08-66]KIM12370.1 MAG: 3-octaprenyl-4-hydroxybenzoate carboxy-lyase [Sulfuricurvum sp. PC08-66]